MNSTNICLLITAFLIISSCKTQVNKKEEIDQKQSVSQNVNKNNLGIFEIYRNFEKPIIKFLKNLEPIEPFYAIHELDMANYPNNVIGVTADESNKILINEKLAVLDSLPKNAKISWSKWPQFNMRTSEEGFHLYLLKKDSKRLTNTDILTAKAAKNQFGDNYVIELEFTDIGTEKWNKLTKRMSEDDRNYIAIVINDEVYSCPYVATQLESPYFVFGEFTNLNEASKIANTIK